MHEWQIYAEDELTDSGRSWGCLTVAHKRELCYTGANKDRCSSQECTCAQADIFSP
jgi:hypothetical protein